MGGAGGSRRGRVVATLAVRGRISGSGAADSRRLPSRSSAELRLMPHLAGRGSTGGGPPPDEDVSDETVPARGGGGGGGRGLLTLAVRRSPEAPAGAPAEAPAGGGC